ncbi:MAG TPA: DUF2721 domain-containing protein [Solimonas sp.]|nr:DUF2721 domain-containing protein [Solimonas sp.]
MQSLNYGTVGLLFPAISLLMLAYTNRFLGLASLVRQLINRYQDHPAPALLQQIESLSHRVSLVRYSQAAGVLSLLLCTVSLFALFLGGELTAALLFGAALLLMLASLLVALREIHLSVRALEIEISAIRGD